MRYFGSFYDSDENEIHVEIVSNGDTSTSREIGVNGLFLSGSDPITITMESDSTLDHLLKKSCTINFVTEDYFADDLFANNQRSIIVNVFKENDCIFAGYAEPNTFEQPFANVLEEFSINCVDAISNLQYTKYNDVTIRNYEEKSVEADVNSFKDIIEGMFTDTFSEINITDNTQPRIIYDCSKGLTSSSLNTIFADLAISDAFIYGDNADDTWTNEDVLENLMKYLNLHIVQEGFDFYIYDWGTLRNGRNTWYDIINGTTVQLPNPSTLTFASAMHGADDTSITVDEVYNQVKVKCDMQSTDTIITSPLESDNLTSPYSKNQLFMREYIAENTADFWYNDYYTFIKMIREPYSTIDVDDDYNSNKARWVDWYFRLMKATNWHLTVAGNNTDITRYYPTENGQYVRPYEIPKLIHDTAEDGHPCSCIIRMGSVTTPTKVKDNSPSTLDMKDYLFITVMGTSPIDPTSRTSEDQSDVTPTPLQLEAVSPIIDQETGERRGMIEYIGSNGGGVYSPSDDDTTNYLVFSGKILLQPHPKETENYYTLKEYFETEQGHMDYVDDTVPSDKNEDGMYYTRKWFTMSTATSPIDENRYWHGISLHPPTEDKQQKLFKYEWNGGAHDTHDMISKIQILECELIIGNKRLVETNIDDYGNSTFQWFALGQEPTYVEDGQTKRKTTFSLGVNPKIDDYIIGTEFDIQNTVTIEMDLDDAKGTAIPIKKSDGLSGAIQFKILGPINATYNNVSRRHPTWFRSEKFYDNNKYVLAHVESIILSDFECKIYSDNAHNEILEDNDLIYMSDMTDKYINDMDDIDFKIITQPTPEVCLDKGIKNEICMNAVLSTNDGVPITSIYNAITQETATAEEHYVNTTYLEYSVPKIIMKATMHNTSMNWRNKYTSNILSKTFMVTASEYDVANNKSKITYKQI